MVTREELLELTDAQLRQVLQWVDKELIRRKEQDQVQYAKEKVIAAIERVIGEQLVFGSRLRLFTDARDAVALWLRRCGMSYSMIGRIIQRDHSSVCTSCNRAEDKLDMPTMYPEFNKIYTDFINEITKHDSKD